MYAYIYVNDTCMCLYMCNDICMHVYMLNDGRTTFERIFNLGVLRLSANLSYV